MPTVPVIVTVPVAGVFGCAWTACVISREGSLSPTSFVAMTRSVYVWLPVRFVMVWGVGVGVGLRGCRFFGRHHAGTFQLPVESFHWTLYPVMSDPPLPTLERWASQSWIDQDGPCQRRLSSPGAVEEAVRSPGGLGATVATTGVAMLWRDSRLPASS